MKGVCPSWLSFILYNPLRKRFTDRMNILKESSITEGSVAVEVGAGNGFLTEVIAEIAKKVIVVELQDGMVRKLKRRVSKFGDKVDIITADIASHELQEGIADVCLLYYCFHEFADKQGAVRNVTRAVKNGGVLSIYEPTVEVGNDDMFKTIGMFTEAGFEKEREYNKMFTRFARLRKPD